MASAESIQRELPGVVGRSIVAGRAADGPADAELRLRAVNPATGTELPPVYIAATGADVDRAAKAAWEAFHAMHAKTGKDRAALLEACAERIMAEGDGLIAMAAAETGLPTSRLISERERTVSTLRMFARAAAEGSWAEATIDAGDPLRKPVAKPDLRRMLRPVGPVAVFGASNFPLAYSTAGGDTASALGAGCPVVVKGHPAHPGTGEIVARALTAAVSAAGFHPGMFSFLHSGGERESAVGIELVKHACIRGVGFTGSFSGGTALARLAGERADPIPVFAEMGSVNPVFLLPQALEQYAQSIAEKLTGSITSGNGQMCTCPGLIFVIRSDGAEAFMRGVAELMHRIEPAPMLSHRVRLGFAKRISEVMAVPGVEVRAGSPMAPHRSGAGAEKFEKGYGIFASPVLLKTRFETFRRNPTLAEECFGPSAIVVVCEDERDLLEAAASIQGSLTGSIFAGSLDTALVRQLQGILEQRVGRLVFNGVPTGVEVAGAMVQGGPWPATNAPHTTAVGWYAMKRWARPVCYQNAPEVLLPMELRDENALGMWRLVNGEWGTGGVEKSR
ncbi:MAG: aldehyde dehydrogenase (NADP(+)) [Phycisphaerales bacterium]|nr:aldehyde dehydrogenase (NADP(+)) [Phycisphaerales bacterium]